MSLADLDQDRLLTDREWEILNGLLYRLEIITQQLLFADNPQQTVLDKPRLGILDEPGTVWSSGHRNILDTRHPHLHRSIPRPTTQNFPPSEPHHPGLYPFPGVGGTIPKNSKDSNSSSSSWSGHGRSHGRNEGEEGGMDALFQRLIAPRKTMRRKGRKRIKSSPVSRHSRPNRGRRVEREKDEEASELFSEV